MHRLLMWSAVFILLVAAPAGRLSAADSRPTAPPVSSAFTIEKVLHDLAGPYPSASRVSDDLPPGVIAAESLVYASPGGRELQLDLYRPAGPGPFPAVIIVHGGGWETGSRQMERPFAKQLASRGYVAVPVSYRLGPDGRFPQSLLDLRAAVRWLRAHAADYAIAPDDIGAIGGSAGGQLVALLGASNGIAALEGDAASAVQAVVDIDGVADFAGAALIAQEEAKPNATSRFLGGRYSERREVWHAASAITYVSRASAPTLFINSTVSHPILPGRDEMSARLRALGVDSRVVVVPDTPHPFWLVHPWFEQVVAETDAFLRPHLVAPRGNLP